MRLCVNIFIASLLLPWWGSASQPPPAWQSKVDPLVLAAAGRGQAEFLILLAEQADLSPAAGLPTKTARGQFVYQRLVETASRSQAPLLSALAAQGAQVRSFWIANLVWARGSQAALQAAALRPEVKRITANPSLQLPPPQPVRERPAAAGQVEWNIQQIGAPQAWAQGFTGQGVVVAGQDTGYLWTHPALQGKYRGWDGAAADHNYSWHDAIHQDNPNTQPGNPCGFDSPVPCDDYGHGTHTMGTIVGDDGQGNQIGVAPGARWIGCRNMEQGWGRPSTYIECFQWFVAPTDLNGQNPRPDLAPDVINNSWTCPASEGCSWDVLEQVIENVRQAGILVVVAAGNQGSSCGTIVDPPAIYGPALTVGATDPLDRASLFSSRGPALHTGLLKPDLSAPGEDIRSSNRFGGYAFSSGTSMAAPHVAGAAALVLSFAPALRGQVDAIEEVLRGSALPLPATETCGGIPAGQTPNNTFGWGRLDAEAALAGLRIAVSKIALPPAVPPGGGITYVLSLTNPLPITTTQVVLTDTLPLKTNFASATPPYQFDGSQVTWEFPALGPHQSLSVILQVVVEQDFPGPVVNQQYQASSLELVHPAPAVPVTVPVGEIHIFPLIYR